MSGIVAIHQPNFFPWMGYFDKIRRADFFIFLDAVSYPRSGSGSMGSWCNRVKLHVNGEPRWVTCPLRRMPLGSLISDAEIDDRQPWRKKLIRTLEANYRREPGYSAAMSLIEPLVMAKIQRLADFNIEAIKAIAAHLEIGATFCRQSQLDIEGQSTDRLVAIVRSVGGRAYLAGGGAAGYQQDELFAANGLELIPQAFEPRPYGTRNGFMPGLSVIDYLMRDGTPLRGRGAQ